MADLAILQQHGLSDGIAIVNRWPHKPEPVPIQLVEDRNKSLHGQKAAVMQARACPCDVGKTACKDLDRCTRTRLTCDAFDVWLNTGPR